jgi:hypothetical protein
MAGDLLPMFQHIFDSWRAPLSHRTVAESPEGEEVEVRCERCCDTGRIGDHPCDCEAGEPGRRTT